MSNKKDLTGQKFARLLVIKDSGKRTTYQKILWECRCDCGSIVFVVGQNLINGNTRSCSCLQKEEAGKRLYKDGRSKDPFYNQRLRLKKLYNITLEDFLELYKKQDYKCKICNTDLDSHKFRQFMNIDHCHKTNKIRGILCSSCNVGLGSFKDSVVILNKAIEYLNAN